MTDWKPKDLNDVLEDIIGSAIQQYVEETVDSQNHLGPEFIPAGRFKDIEDKAVKDIIQSDYIEIRFKADVEEIREGMTEKEYWFKSSEGHRKDAQKYLNKYLGVQERYEEMIRSDSCDEECQAYKGDNIKELYDE